MEEAKLAVFGGVWGKDAAAARRCTSSHSHWSNLNPLVACSMVVLCGDNAHGWEQRASAAYTPSPDRRQQTVKKKEVQKQTKALTS